MLPNHLSSQAEALLQQLRASPSVGVFDRDAAEELISAGLAKHIPATGTIEATDAARSHGDDAEVPVPTALPATEMVGRKNEPLGRQRSGQGSDSHSNASGFAEGNLPTGS